MDRRRFLLTTLAGAFATPLAAEAQQAGKVYRIGVLLPLGVTPPILASFLAGMRDRGWVENQGFVAEPRYAEGRLERLPELAAALVRLKVDVLVTMGTPATMAAKHGPRGMAGGEARAPARILRSDPPSWQAGAAGGVGGGGARNQSRKEYKSVATAGGFSPTGTARAFVSSAATAARSARLAEP